MTKTEILHAIFGDGKAVTSAYGHHYSCLVCYPISNPNWLVDMEVLLQTSGVSLTDFVAKNHNFELRSGRLALRTSHNNFVDCTNPHWIVDVVEEAIQIKS